ncbi:MAG: VPLPA-CTERM sorting domain-containing protein [Gammaproteobacteria bacterium]|nr:VPLPA-CTERM sorting domain-containing protein [Gammaproteobacteria bacterium]
MLSNTQKLTHATLIGALALVGAPASAHQTYNLTGVNTGIANSVNNSDGVSNIAGYGPVGVGGRVNGDSNANIPGTGGLPTDYVGALPYMEYLGHHDSTAAGTTTRNGVTGTAATTPNSLWRAYAIQDASPVWGSLVPDIGSSHPYVAVGGNSWQVGSTAGGLDYNLIHASTGTNDDLKNVTTAGAAIGQIYQIDITLKRDSAYDAENDVNALLDVALYRGADASAGASRTAAFDPNANGVQGSTLGTGGKNGSALLWSAHQTSAAEVLHFTLLIDFNEWKKTDALEGALNDGLAGFYTLVIGAHGGAVGSALTYSLETRSFTAVAPAPVPVPAAAWLLGSAFGVMGALQRRRRNVS